MVRRAWAKLRATLRRGTIEQELREELDAHLQMEMDANLDRGMTPEAALQSAKRQLGNQTGIHEIARHAWTFDWIETSLSDVRYALRTLRRSPGFTVTAVSVIALGIGATTAAFTLLDHVVLRPLPFPHPEQLVMLYQHEPARILPRIESSPPNFVDWRAMNRSFSSMGAYAGPGSITLSGFGEPMRIGMAFFNADVLETLDVRPGVGRGFTAEDDRDDGADVVLLSEGLAVTLFGSATAAVRRLVTLDNRPREVIGVMPRGFVFPTRDTVLWMPLSFSRVGFTRTNHILNVIARLRPGVAVTQARAEMTAISSQLARAYPEENAGVGAAVVDVKDVMSPQSRLLVTAVFGAALCLLLIACTNLATLWLARAVARRQEMAIRVAIGAGRGRLVRQLLTEAVVLAGAGGVIGTVLARSAVPWLSRFVPSALPVSDMPAVDVRVWGFAAMLTLATSLLSGVGPGLRSWRQADPQALRAGSGGPRDRLRAALVLAEIAGTVTLLVGAGLLVKALWQVQAVNPGFDVRGVLTLQTALPMPKYGGAPTRHDFYDRVLRAVRALPGVTAAGYTTGLPLVFGAGIFPATVPGLWDEASAPRASIRAVTPGFFTTLKIPLRKGRYLGDEDDAAAPPVTVISESLAKQLWPGQEAIGRQVTLFRSERTIVGVVGDITVRGLEPVSEPQVYFSADQLAPFSTFYAPKDLVIRAAGDPGDLVPALRRIVRRVDPDQPISNVRMLDEIFEAQTAPRRDQLFVLGSCAAMAFALAAIGIHGLLSFTVSARTTEIGIRVALGASRGRILNMFLRQGLLLGAIGMTVSVPIAYAAARGMSALLFGVPPGDPIVYGSALLLAMLMTVLGTLHPAVRASTVDPALTIRAQ